MEGQRDAGPKGPFKMKAAWQRFVDNVYWNTELEP